MANQTLCIGGNSVATIKEGKFYILKHYNNMGLNEVSKGEFKEHLKKYKKVCNDTWSEELKENYKAICKAVR